MKDRRIDHINNVIQPRDVEQFIRSCYLNINWDLSDKEFDGYIEHIRKQAFENWYAEEDLQKVISDWKDIANNMEGLTIDFS